MDLKSLKDALRGFEGVVGIELEGNPPTAMRVLVASEAVGEQLVEIPLLLLRDQFATVWIPGHRALLVVPRLDR